ncbi:E3 ubiquitin-protein ligase XIAP-like [Gigantopelta aegis]|uniref:E3 ubiquitin-protein ligase XIAP-like n=1 Tax=Gigantopelta aegis TaxID=1735272 RepID=UPI001B88904A|nr:E3 ubiquitin-protein ligase XIAP-like [Gigantopelta aegis]
MHPVITIDFTHNTTNDNEFNQNDTDQDYKMPKNRCKEYDKRINVGEFSQPDIILHNNSSERTLPYISKGLKSVFQQLVNSLEPAERHSSSAQKWSSEESFPKNLQTGSRSPEPENPQNESHVLKMVVASVPQTSDRSPELENLKDGPEVLEKDTTRILDNPAYINYSAEYKIGMMSYNHLNNTNSSDLPPCESRHSGSIDARSSNANSSDVRSSDANSSDARSRDDRYNDEMVRYASFDEFPSTSAWPNRLAAAGFYHSGPDDQVTCYSCGMSHRNWRHTDDPMEIHRRVSSGCRFVLGQEENHPVEVQEEARDRLIRISGVSPNLLSNLLSRHTDNTGPAVEAASLTGTSSAVLVMSTTSMESTMLVTSSGAAYSSGSLLLDRPITDNELFGSPSTAGGNLTVGHGTTQTASASAGLTTADTMIISSTHVQLPPDSSRNSDRPPRTWQQPKYPKYADLDTRILTFAGRWPHPNNQTPRQLGEAGFFFSGNSQDSTTCYFCGGGLKNWIRGDNPFVEHARWFSQCEFIREVKGDKFVDLVQEMNENKEEIDYKQVMAIVTDTRPMTERLGIRTRHVDATPSDPQTDSMQDNLPGTSSENSNTSTSSKEALSTAPGPASEGTGEQLTCKVCLENNVSVVFLPCGHLCCCVDCAARLRKCPLCRSRIEGTVRAYLG